MHGVKDGAKAVSSWLSSWCRRRRAQHFDRALDSATRDMMTRIDDVDLLDRTLDMMNALVTQTPPRSALPVANVSKSEPSDIVASFLLPERVASNFAALRESLESDLASSDEVASWIELAQSAALARTSWGHSALIQIDNRLQSALYATYTTEIRDASSMTDKINVLKFRYSCTCLSACMYLRMW